MCRQDWTVGHGAYSYSVVRDRTWPILCRGCLYLSTTGEGKNSRLDLQMRKCLFVTSYYRFIVTYLRLGCSLSPQEVDVCPAWQFLQGPADLDRCWEIQSKGEQCSQDVAVDRSRCGAHRLVSIIPYFLGEECHEISALLQDFFFIELTGVILVNTIICFRCTVL